MDTKQAKAIIARLVELDNLADSEVCAYDESPYAEEMDWLCSIIDTTFTQDQMDMVPLIRNW